MDYQTYKRALHAALGMTEGEALPMTEVVAEAIRQSAGTRALVGAEVDHGRRASNAAR